MSSNKKQFGQFFTTNYNYIFTEFDFINKIKTNECVIVEPFAGQCDLIKYLYNFLRQENINLELFDIETDKNDLSLIVEKNDSLINPPNYNDKFVLTNPPYLACNKSKDKIIYEKYKQDDLYKCFLESILESDILGGAIIIPLNFLSSVRKNDIDLRLRFFKKFKIDIINIFEEQVFDDTKYSVCSIQFFRIDYKDNTLSHDHDNTIINIFKDKKKQKSFNFDTSSLNINNFGMIGGSIYDTNLYKIDKDIYISRLTSKNKQDLNITRIYVKCIDDNSLSRICMKYLEQDEDLYIDNTKNLSARSFMTLIISIKKNNTTRSIDENFQRLLVKEFNEFLDNNRKKYNSLFLTNFRESSDIARKRISFSLVYNITNYLIQKIFSEI
jgi:hypothetical protein